MEQDEWIPPTLSDEQLQALEKNKPTVSNRLINII